MGKEFATGLRRAMFESRHTFRIVTNFKRFQSLRYNIACQNKLKPNCQHLLLRPATCVNFTPPPYLLVHKFTDS